MLRRMLDIHDKSNNVGNVIHLMRIESIRQCY